MNKRVIIISVILFISFIVLIAFFWPQKYRPFTWDGSDCVTYIKDCTCYGIVISALSYPPIYDCQGIEFCEDINIVECRD